jgi:hypothetical protein
MLQSFFAYDSSVRNGLSIAAGDVNADGITDIITGAGAGGGPHVKAFDGRSLELLSSFFAYEATFQGGVNVAAGDLNGDGRAEIITGAGPGGGPLVRIFDSVPGRATIGFLAFIPQSTDGIDVGYRLRKDGVPTLTVSEIGGIGRINTYAGPKLQLIANLSEPEPGFLGGIEVG